MDCVFTNATGSTRWNDPANWLDRRIPGRGDRVRVKAGQCLDTNPEHWGLETIHLGRGATVHTLNAWTGAMSVTMDDPPDAPGCTWPRPPQP